MSLYKFIRNWWWVVLRGLFAVIFVLASFFGTYLTLRALVLLFGVYSLIDGLVVAMAGLTYPPGARPAWRFVLEGLLGIGAGTVSFLAPGLTSLSLLYLIVGWAVVRGALEIASAMPLVRAVDKRRLVALGAALILALSALLVIWPRPAGLGLYWLTGAYALLFGLLQIGLGLRIRNWHIRWMRPLRLHPVGVQAGRAAGWRTRQALARAGPRQGQIA